jgi:hypothetical protein
MTIPAGGAARLDGSNANRGRQWQTPTSRLHDRRRGMNPHANGTDTVAATTDAPTTGAYPDGDAAARRSSADVVGPFTPTGFARRDSLRVPVGRPADVLALAPGATLRRWLPCELRDISASGAAIVLDDLDVQPGETVLVRLHSGDVLVLQVAGEVVRSAETGDTTLYGIRFSALPEARRAQIIDLVMTLYGARMGRLRS